MKEQKYYFITYAGYNVRDRDWMYWNDVIDKSPMEFIIDASEREENPSARYSPTGEIKFRHMHIAYSMEISRKEYEKFKGHF